MHSQQKQYLLSLLQNHFTCTLDDIEHAKFKKVESNTNVFSPGDPILHIYFVLEGDIQIVFQGQYLPVPVQSIVGDFEMIKQLTNRTTTMRASHKSKIIILPKDLYNKMKTEITHKQQFLSKHLHFQNPRLNYMITKCFIKKSLKKGDWAVPEDQTEQFIIIIKSGLFLLKKQVNPILRKTKPDSEKEYMFVHAGEGDVLRENVCCDSVKGLIYICNGRYSNKLIKNFPELAELVGFQSEEAASPHLERQKSNKKLTIQNCEQYQLILPTVLFSQRLKNKKQKLKTQPIFRKNKKELQKNHFQIKRQRDNILFCEQTNSNFELVPLVRIRKPSCPHVARYSREKVLQRFFKCRMSKGERELSQQNEEQVVHITEPFEKKFQKKMLLRPSNPFHHHKTYQSRPCSLSSSPPRKQATTPISLSMQSKYKMSKFQNKLLIEDHLFA